MKHLFYLQMKVLLASLLLLYFYPSNGVSGKQPVILSGKNRFHEEPMSSENGPQLRVYCFHGMQKRFFRLWHSVFLNLSCIPEDLEVFIGRNESEVLSRVSETQSYFLNVWWSVAVWKKGAIPITPFDLSCVGIRTVNPYEVRLCWKVDFFRIIISICGVILFLKAKSLSRHVAFYYSVGISVSLVASIVLVVLILHRFIPFRRGFYFLMFISSTTCLALLDYVVTHIESLFLERHTLLISYVAVVSSVSFAVLYFFSPKALNPRSYNLIQWGLQTAGILCIFFSSQIPEVAFGIIAIILFFYNFPQRVIYRFRAYWHRWFPKPRRYVSEDEYREIVAEATKRALDDLRDFARSPKCKSWKLVGRLRSPTRFASFVEGESHITDAEEELYIQGNRSASSVESVADTEVDDESLDGLDVTDDSLDFNQSVTRHSPL